jgi:hypothetical protein
MAKATASTIVIPDAGNYVQDAAVSTDGSTIVYSLRDSTSAYNLHAIDLTQATPVDKAITSDGKSCHPGF